MKPVLFNNTVLRDGHYVPEAKTTQTVTLDRPFRVTVTLADLSRGLRR